MFTIRNLNYASAGGVSILKQVSVEIPAGKITSLIGPSGSGKSTLLRCLNRLSEPPPDTIFLEGVDITTLDVLALRRRVGMLFQQAALFEGSIADNVAYGPALRGESLPPERLTGLLEMVGLPETMAHKSAQTLSGGEAQRAALARTLANEPEALLLDEPTSALDPAATRHVEETILHLRDRLNLTVIWVSHLIDQVERVADEVILLAAGEVIETGPFGQLQQIDRFAAGEW